MPRINPCLPGTDHLPGTRYCQRSTYFRTKCVILQLGILLWSLRFRCISKQKVQRSLNRICSETMSEKNRRKQINRVGRNFPVKLHFMLNELKVDGMEAIASWQSHGRSFIVHKPKVFEIEIIPLYVSASSKCINYCLFGWALGVFCSQTT